MKEYMNTIQIFNITVLQLFMLLFLQMIPPNDLILEIYASLNCRSRVYSQDLYSSQLSTNYI